MCADEQTFLQGQKRPLDPLDLELQARLALSLWCGEPNVSLLQKQYGNLTPEASVYPRPEHLGELIQLLVFVRVSISVMKVHGEGNL